MKLTLGSFAGALLLAIAALLVPYARPPTAYEAFVPEPLAIDGVDTVVLRGPAWINLGGDLPATIDGRGCDTAVRRDGATLHVEASGEGYRCPQLNLPAGIVRIEAGAVEISATEPLDALAVTVDESLGWSGPIALLQVDAPPQAVADCSARHARGTPCDTRITIDANRVARLEVRSDGRVVLNEPDGVERAILMLGPNARLDVTGASGFDNIEIVRAAADTEAATEAATAAPTD